MASSSEVKLTKEERAWAEQDPLEAQERLALLAQQKEFEFESAREKEAKQWLPNLTGEMDPPSQTGPYPQPTA